MKGFAIRKWSYIGLANLAIVAIYGVVMRYKIAFEFPYFDQKNLQHAHSHFAFSGWVSFVLMALMIDALSNGLSTKTLRKFTLILRGSLLCSYGMLISFTCQGYGPASIFFATASIIISFIFCLLYYKSLKGISNITAKRWFSAALVFNILSACGTFYLSYMMSTHSIIQQNYLAAIYWYLHYQYNGWFFFACVGLILYYLEQQGIFLKGRDIIFWLFSLSCIPAYGLSVLWLSLPLWVMIIISLAALAQFLGGALLVFRLQDKRIYQLFRSNKTALRLLIFGGIALLIKLTLQLGSMIPATSKLAFGSRTIVIAYLHLVLLAFITVIIIAYMLTRNIIPLNKMSAAGIIIFVAGIFFNEIILGIQGIASFTYTYILYANESLVAVSFVLLTGIMLVNFGILKDGKGKHI